MTAVVLFVASAGLILYVLAGYPTLLALYARAFPRPIKKQDAYPFVSVIVPVRNGAAWVEQKIRSLLASDYPADRLELLIVSDGSVDATDDLVASYPDPRLPASPSCWRQGDCCQPRT